MSEKFKELQGRIARELLPVVRYPNTVLDREIRSRNFTVGDYKLEYAPEWSGSNIYYQAKFPQKVGWDYDKSMDLSSLIKKYPRFDLLNMKEHLDVVDIITRRTPITPKMLYDNFIVFDKVHYESRGVDKMLEDLGNHYGNYIPQWDGVAKSRHQAEEWFSERIVGAIGEDRIVLNDIMLYDGSELLDEIGRKFFGASTG